MYNVGNQDEWMICPQLIQRLKAASGKRLKRTPSAGCGLDTRTAMDTGDFGEQTFTALMPHIDFLSSSLISPSRLDWKLTTLAAIERASTRPIFAQSLMRRTWLEELVIHRALKEIPASMGIFGVLKTPMSARKGRNSAGVATGLQLNAIN